MIMIYSDASSIARPTMLFALIFLPLLMLSLGYLSWLNKPDRCYFSFAGRLLVVLMMRRDYNIYYSADSFKIIFTLKVPDLILPLPCDEVNDLKSFNRYK